METAGTSTDSRPVSKAIPNVKDEGIAPFDYIVVCTKNIPDIPPTVSEIIAPAVTPGHTAIVLVQNGLNIEKPVIAAFPSNIVISGISRMSSAELTPGQIFHQDHDILIIGAFRNPSLEQETELASAKHFAELYNASGKATGQYDEDVAFMRWRKLCYNASYNSLCAITGMDTSRLRLAGTPVHELLLPVILEIKSIARAAGVRLAADQEDASLAGDAIDAYFRPSMQQDIEKVRTSVFPRNPVSELELTPPRETSWKWRSSSESRCERRIDWAYPLLP